MDDGERLTVPRATVPPNLATLTPAVPSSVTPVPASSTQSRSIRRLDDAIATASGPRNSIVTAMPSGILAMAW